MSDLDRRERAELKLRIERAMRDLRSVVDREMGLILQDLARLEEGETGEKDANG